MKLRELKSWPKEKRPLVQSYNIQHEAHIYNQALADCGSLDLPMMSVVEMEKILKNINKMGRGFYVPTAKDLAEALHKAMEEKVRGGKDDTQK